MVTTLRDLSIERRDGPAATSLDRSVDNPLDNSVDLTERRLRVTVEQSPIGAATLTTHGRVLDGNRVLARMLGRAREQLAGLSLAEITHPDDGAREAVLYEKLLTGKINAYELEKRFTRPDGALVWARQSLATVTSGEGVVVELVLQAQDLTETRAAVERLTHQSRHDPLTGLANRVMCVEAIQRALDRGRRTGLATAVLCCDLDNFKLVNDSLGRAAGDEVLAPSPTGIASVLRPADRVGRFGGDEFVVVVPDAQNGPGVEKVAERISNAIATELTVQGHRIVPTASMGIAVSTSTSTPASLLRDTDSALFRAKYAGRARWHLFDEAMHAQAVARLTLEDELRTRRRDASSSSTTSRSSASATATWSGTRRWSAGSTPPGGCCSPGTSSSGRGVRDHRGDRAAAARRGLALLASPTRASGRGERELLRRRAVRPRLARARRGHGPRPRRRPVAASCRGHRDGVLRCPTAPTRTSCAAALGVGVRSTTSAPASPRSRSCATFRSPVSSSTAASCATSPTATARRTRSPQGSRAWRRGCTWPGRGGHRDRGPAAGARRQGWAHGQGYLFGRPEPLVVKPGDRSSG